jgi:regulator of nucleoside diphosphate kinase
MTGTLPPVVISRVTFDRLAALSAAPAYAGSYAADLLERELDRARVVDPPDLPADVVDMGTTVEFDDLASGLARRVTLVYPAEADVGRSLISVMTPVGAALIGLKVRSRISWRPPSGAVRSLLVRSVVAGRPA